MDETVGDPKEKTEVKEAGEKNKDVRLTIVISDTSNIGATKTPEESSTSTTGGGKAVKEADGISEEEEEIAEEEKKTGGSSGRR